MSGLCSRRRHEAATGVLSPTQCKNYRVEITEHVALADSGVFQINVLDVQVTWHFFCPSSPPGRLPDPRQGNPLKLRRHGVVCAVAFAEMAPRPRRMKEHRMARVAPVSTSVDLPSFLSALKAVRQGDFSVRLPDHWTGVAGKVADTFNEVVE